MRGETDEGGMEKGWRDEGGRDGLSTCRSGLRRPSSHAPVSGSLSTAPLLGRKLGSAGAIESPTAHQPCPSCACLPCAPTARALFPPAAARRLAGGVREAVCWSCRRRQCAAVVPRQ